MGKVGGLNHIYLFFVKFHVLGKIIIYLKESGLHHTHTSKQPILATNSQVINCLILQKPLMLRLRTLMKVLRPYK